MIDRIIASLVNLGPYGVIFAVIAGVVVGASIYFASGKR